MDLPIHLRRAASATDFSSALAPAGPASPKRGSCRGGSGQEEEALRLAALGPQDADRRIRCPFPPLADRSQLMLSETLHGVHLAATPGQLQLLNPASKCCGESPTQPSCCPFRHRGLEGRKEIPPLPRPLQAGTITTGKMRVQTSNTGEQVLSGHFAKGGKDEKRGKGEAKETNRDQRTRSKPVINQSLLSASHPWRCTLSKDSGEIRESHRKGQNLFQSNPLILLSPAVQGILSDGLPVKCELKARRELSPTTPG